MAKSYAASSTLLQLTALPFRPHCHKHYGLKHCLLPLSHHEDAITQLIDLKVVLEAQTGVPEVLPDQPCRQGELQVTMVETSSAVHKRNCK